MPRLHVPGLPPGVSLGTPKILSTGATLLLGPIRLHVENWECRAEFLAHVNGVLYAGFYFTVMPGGQEAVICHSQVIYQIPKRIRTHNWHNEENELESRDAAL